MFLAFDKHPASSRNGVLANGLAKHRQVVQRTVLCFYPNFLLVGKGTQWHRIAVGFVNDGVTLAHSVQYVFIACGDRWRQRPKKLPLDYENIGGYPLGGSIHFRMADTF